MAKVMVSLPDDLLGEVKRRSTSRSALIAVAARRELARQDPEEFAAAIGRSERRFSTSGSFESEDVAASALTLDPAAALDRRPVAAVRGLTATAVSVHRNVTVPTSIT